jgi:hypothetical protein
MTVLKAKSLVRESGEGKKKAVRCIDTGIVYASSRDAADILAMEGASITPEGITHTCLGRQKTTRGFHWEYAIEQQRVKR